MPATVDRPPRRPFAQDPHYDVHEGASSDVVDFVARWGRSSVSPFHCEPGRTMVDLDDGVGRRLDGRARNCVPGFLAWAVINECFHCSLPFL